MAVYTGTVKGKNYSVTLPDDASAEAVSLAVARKAGVIPEGFKGTFKPRELGISSLKKEKTSAGGSFLSAFAQIPLLNAQDELKAVKDTALHFAQRMASRVGKAPTKKEIKETYLSNLDREAQREEADWKAHPRAGWSGTGAGVVATIASGRGLAQLPKAGAPLRWAAAPTSVGEKATRSALLAVPTGAAAGGFAAKPGERKRGAVEGAVIAPAVAAATPFALKPISGLANWAWARFGPRSWASNPTGWAEELSSRLKGIVSPEDLRKAKAVSEKAGIKPAPIDVAGRPGQDIVAEVGSRPGAKAQPILEAEAIKRAEAAPARIAQQARDIISKARLPGKTGKAEPLLLREDLGRLRNKQFGASIEPIRRVRLAVPSTVVDALRYPDLRPAVNGALKFAKNDAERAQLVKFGKELVTTDDTGKAAKISDLSLGATEALRRSLGKMEGPKTPVITMVRQELAEYLESSSPRYKQAMDTYRAQSAVAGPGKLGTTSKLAKEQGEAITQGQEILTGSPEKMRMQQRNLGDMDTPIEFRPPDPSKNVDITPRQAAAEGALGAIETSAGGKKGAESIVNAMNTEQQQLRNRIILAGADADALEANIAAEATRVAAAKRAMPQKFQSETAEQTGNAALSGSGIFSTSPVIQARAIGGVVSILERAAISKGLAERIAKNAIDPEQTDTLINTMIKEGIREEEARGLLRGVRALVARGAAGFNAEAQAQQAEGATVDLFDQEKEYDYEPATSADDEYDYSAVGALAAPKADLEPTAPAEGYVSDVGDEYSYEIPPGE